jgi:hypothetical protein
MKRLFLAVALGGCFSSANFEVCENDSQCGFGDVCVSGGCEPIIDEPDAGLDRGPPPDLDAGPRPDAAPEGDERVIEGEVGMDLRAIVEPDKRVVLRDVVLRAGFLSVEAREIVVEGGIRADGAGHPGGGGGGGGAAGHTVAMLRPGDGGRNGARGSANDGPSGGDGGDGADGAGPSKGGGGPGGVAGGLEGGAGADGRWAPEAFDGCGFAVGFRLGSGGGGGGGGAGGTGNGCISGGGGGGGGAGGPGGGAVHLQAAERIVVRGSVSARGVGVLESQQPASAGGEACPGGDAPETCAEGCDPETSGRGGEGGDAQFSAQGGGEGGAASDAEAGGHGGPGGGGGGGMVRLVAPAIVFEGGARLDVSGSTGEGNGGLVMIQGRRQGEAQVVGAAFRCEGE